MPGRSLTVLVSALLAGMLALAAGCGSAVPPVQWATRVCAAVKPWRSQIADLNTRAQQQMSTATTPAETRDNLSALLAGGRDASETARAAVVAAGVPDVDGGDQVAQRFVDSLTKARDAYDHARSDLQGLSTADAASFYDGVVALLGRLQTEYAASGIDTSNLDSPDLRQAFDGADQCR